MMVAAQAAMSLRRTPLYSLHRELGARMVPFAGYEMPLHYALGILKEHLHVRAAVGLFDVSHMGQLFVRAHRRDIADVAAALECVLPVDLRGLAIGRQRYALLTNEKGGIRDDLIISRMDDRFLIVLNAACKDTDENYLAEALAGKCKIERREERTLLALQGPLAEKVLASVVPEVAALRFMDVRRSCIFGADCIVSRSGYTGEDGFELSVAAAAGEMVARRLLQIPQVAMIGLGARDSLRLEVGLCLYGSDLDTQTTPVEAALEWSIPAARRSGGARAGGFPGAAVILGQVKNGALRRRVGLRPQGRAPIRHGTALFGDLHAGVPIGVVTSGGFGPSVNAPIAMGYVASTYAAAETMIFAELRGERLPVGIARLPFIAAKYRR